MSVTEKDRVYLSDKYNASYMENGVETGIPVYVGLLADGTTNNIPLPDEIYKVYDGLGMGTKTVKTYFSSFEFDSRAKVCIKMPDGTSDISVKPLRYKQKVEFKDGRVYFEVEDTVYLAIEPDGDIFGSIHIFCNKKKEYNFETENVIMFSNGVYNSENCEYIRVDEHGTPIIDQIKDNTVIYIGKNAVVNAAIELVGVKNVKILGTGIISLIDRCDGAAENFEGERFWGSFRYYAKPNILIRSGSENVEIDGVLLNCEFRGIVTRNCENIVIKNVKIFSSTENADGINCYNTSDMLVDNCYIQSADDCFCMYNSCDSIPTLFDEGYDDIKAICKNVEVKNCLMSSNARPVVLGGHATGETKPRCIIENIYMHDCEIVSTPYRIFGNTEEYSMYWSGILRILSQSEQIVRKLRFDNITVNVTFGHNGKPFHLEVRDSKNASYTENAGYRIEDVIFSNINFNGDTSKMLKSLLKCRATKADGDNPCIENIAFKNIRIGGQKLNSDMLVSEGPVYGISIE